MHSDHYGNVEHIQQEYGPGIPVAVMPHTIQPNKTMETLRKHGKL